MTEPIFTLRNYDPATDTPWIVSSWVEATRHMAFARGCSHYAVTVGQTRTIKGILARATCIVACMPDEPGAILGYAVYDHALSRPILYFVHVKAAFRRNGIAAALLASLVGRVVYTHRPVTRGRLPVPAHWEFDPWLNWP